MESTKTAASTSSEQSTKTAPESAEREQSTMESTKTAASTDNRIARTLIDSRERLDSRQLIDVLTMQYSERLPRTAASERTHLIGLLLTSERNDGPSLITRLHQAARNERYRHNETAEYQDDTLQNMLETTTAALLENPALAAESYAYIVNAARWRARDIRRAERTRNGISAYSLDANASADSEQSAHETTADSLTTDAIENANLALDLRIALTQIPRQLANAFVLRFGYGLSYTELSERLGTSENNGQQMVTRARTALREQMPHRKPRANGWTNCTAAKLAGLPANGWTAAKDAKSQRIVKSAAKTENRFKKLLTYGNGEQSTVDHRYPLIVKLASDDDLITLDSERPQYTEHEQTNYQRTSEPADLMIDLPAKSASRSTEYPYHVATQERQPRALYYQRQRQTVKVYHSQPTERTSASDAPAPTHYENPERWTEYNYQTEYNGSELDSATLYSESDDSEQSERTSALYHNRESQRQRWQDGSELDDWTPYQRSDGRAPAPKSEPAPADPAAWLAEYNASLI